MTPNEITTILATHLKQEEDETFKRLLMKEVDGWYSTLVSRSIEKAPSQRVNFRSPLYLVTSQISLTGGCEFPIPLCKIAGTTAKLPLPMRTEGMLFDYVGSIDGQNPFRRADPGTAFYLGSGRYSKDTIFYDYTTAGIRILNRKTLPAIMVNTVWDSPTAVMDLNCAAAATADACDFWNKDYPAPNDIIQMIIQYVLQVNYGQPVVLKEKDSIPVTDEGK